MDPAKVLLQEKSCGARILLTFEKLPLLQSKDLIRVSTKLKKPAHAQNPGGFDYRLHLRRQGIFLTGFVKEGSWEVLQKASSFHTETLRRRLSGRLDEVLQTNAASFLKALILGDRSTISEIQMEEFRRTGIVHLIAISGQHIGMVVLSFSILFLWVLKRSERVILYLPVRKLSLGLSILPAIFYTELSGGSPSAMRAILFVCVIFCAQVFDREGDSYTSLAVVALVMLLMDHSALFSISFQLSFLAVLGILFVGKTVNNTVHDAGHGEQVEPWKNFFNRYLRRPFWMGTGAFLFTAPWVAYQFHQVSLSGILWNLLAVPFASLLLLTTAWGLAIDFLTPMIGKPLLVLCGWLTNGFLFFIHEASKVSWFVSIYPSLLQVVGSYLFVGILIFLLFKPHVWKRIIFPASAVLLMIFLGGHHFPNELQVTFIDVGQGDSTLVQTPQGKSLLIDGGGFLIPGQKANAFDVGKEVVVPLLHHRGVRRLDAILLSHPHPDHYGGLAAVIREFDVGEFWWNGQEFPDESFQKLLSLLQAKRIPIKLLLASQKFTWNDLQMEVLYPEKVISYRNINDNSLVLRMTYGAARFLFPGDIEKIGEETLSDKVDIQATVLKIPHHASRTSSSIPFIDSVQPLYAVASFAEGNFFGFPHPDILERYERRGVRVFRTDKYGAVTFQVPSTFPKPDISIEATSSRW